MYSQCQQNHNDVHEMGTVLFWRLVILKTPVILKKTRSTESLFVPQPVYHETKPTEWHGK